MTSGICLSWRIGYIKKKQAAIKESRSILERELTKEELSQIAEIVIIDRGNPVPASFQQMFWVQHSIMEFKNSTFKNLYLRHAFVFTSQGQPFNPQAN